MDWQLFLHFIEFCTCPVGYDISCLYLLDRVGGYAELHVLQRLVLICLEALDDTLEILMRHGSIGYSLFQDTLGILGLHLLEVLIPFRSTFKRSRGFPQRLGLQRHEGCRVLEELLCFDKLFALRLLDVFLSTVSNIELHFALDQLETFAQQISWSLLQNLIDCLRMNGMCLVISQPCHDALVSCIRTWSFLTLEARRVNGAVEILVPKAILKSLIEVEPL